ncbi:MAG: redoxin domain-containing protein [Actinomycetota bacterium]
MISSRSIAGIGAGVLGVAVVAALAATSTGADDAPAAVPATDPAAAEGTAASERASAGSTAPTTSPPTNAPSIELPNRGLHPEFREIDGWLQSDVTSLEALRGKVVAVQFWTFGCHNCTATLPHMQALYENYGGDDFEIVGIHAPEFDWEADVGNIEQAADELGVTWPIVLDTNKRTFHYWQEGPTGHWPRIYLLDRDGNIRYDHIGEGRYDEIDEAVQALLAEPA